MDLSQTVDSSEIFFWVKKRHQMHMKAYTVQVFAPHFQPAKTFLWRVSSIHRFLHNINSLWGIQDIHRTQNFNRIIGIGVRRKETNLCCNNPSTSNMEKIVIKQNWFYFSPFQALLHFPMGDKVKRTGICAAKSASTPLIATSLSGFVESAQVREWV
jgi:hypothetical protein